MQRGHAQVEAQKVQNSSLATRAKIIGASRTSDVPFHHRKQTGDQTCAVGIKRPSVMGSAANDWQRVVRPALCHRFRPDRPMLYGFWRQSSWRARDAVHVEVAVPSVSSGNRKLSARSPTGNRYRYASLSSQPVRKTLFHYAILRNR